MGAFADPFDPDKLLWNGCPCGQHRSMLEHQMAMQRANGGSRFRCEAVAPEEPSPTRTTGRPATGPRHDPVNCFDPSCVLPECVAMRARSAQAADPRALRQVSGEPDGTDMEETLARCVESAVMRGLFGTDVNRRRFLRHRWPRCRHSSRFPRPRR